MTKFGGELANVLVRVRNKASSIRPTIQRRRDYALRSRTRPDRFQRTICADREGYQIS